ncbi:MAG: hypothetical protein OSJ70_03520 [Bacilli bacterium]|nr:hypothetical protein [Bacilli bacterium]
MRKINKATGVVIFTVLALGTIGIADYSKSGAKYYKDVEKGLTYNMGLSKLTTDGLGNLSSRKDLSEVDKLYLEYSVPRNMIMTEEDTTDKYRIVVDKGCEIKKVNGSNITSSSNTYTFTYSDKLAKNISVAYVCPVSSVEVSSTSDFMNPNLSIYEQMSTDVKEFIYTKKDALFKKSESLPQPVIGDYHQLIILETDDETTINRKVEEWLTNNRIKYADANSGYPWANSTVTNAILKQYLKKAYTTDIKQFDNTLIKGISFSHVGNEYIYTLDESFIAYALTDYYYDSSVKERTFYFSDITKTDAELQNIFEYYIDKYYYKNGTKEYTDLLTYINNYGGIAQVIKGTNVNGIPGIKYYKEGRLELQEKLMDYVYPSVDKTVTVDTNVTTSTTEIKKALANGLLINYPELINDKIYNFFSSYDYDVSTIARYRKNTAYNDYLIYNLDGKTTIINVTSNGDNVINATASVFDENAEIDFSTATTVSISMGYDSSLTNQIVNEYQTLTSIIDTKYGSNYANVSIGDLINNYVNGEGLYIDSRSQSMVIKAYLVNSLDHYNFGTLPSTNGISVDDATNGSPDISITDNPEDVVAGDTPNEDIPIFDDLVTTEPSDTITDSVPGENETETETPEKQESEEQEEDKTEEVDDNSKKADTDIEKEFVRDIEEVEKLIEDMKDFVGDAEQVSAEEEAIAEVDELIETVKDYVNEA